MVYSLRKQNQGLTIVRLNNFILTMVKVQLINDVAIITIASNTLRGDTIRLGDLHVGSDARNEILEKLFAGEELNHNEFIL